MTTGKLFQTLILQILRSKSKFSPILAVKIKFWFSWTISRSNSSNLQMLTIISVLTKIPTSQHIALKNPCRGKFSAKFEN